MPVHKLILLIALVPYAMALWAGWSHFSDPKNDRKAHGAWGIRLGSGLNLLAVVLYYRETGIFPGARPFGFYCIYVLVTVVASRILARRQGLERVNFAFLVIPIVTLLPLPFVPVDPPASSRLPDWLLGAHLATVVLSLSAFTIAVTAGWMLYTQNKMLKTKKEGLLRTALPPLEILDRLTYQSMATGFAVLTMGLGLGFLAMFVLDPIQPGLGENPMRLKAALGLTVWAIYGYYLFRRRNRGWRGRTAALYAGIGFAAATAVSLLATLGSKAAPHL